MKCNINNDFTHFLELHIKGVEMVIFLAFDFFFLESRPSTHAAVRR